MVHAGLIIIILQLFFKFNLSINKKNLPLWTWECVNEVCVPLKASHSGKLQSLTTCNVVCSGLQLWPQPTGIVSVSSAGVPVNAYESSLTIESSPSKTVSAFIRNAFTIFRNNLNNICNKTQTALGEKQLSIKVTINSNGSEDPRMLVDTDESYNLRIQPVYVKEPLIVVEIAANSFCGARHAMETLSQLMWFDPYVNSLFIIESATVSDMPRFRYRGLMIDTAQTYFPVPELIRMIDAMASCKLNTFHWYATNAEAFPLTLNCLPETAKFISRGYGPVYSLEDIHFITNYAKDRGIRVVMEVNLAQFLINHQIHSHLYGCEETYCKENNSNMMRKFLKQIYTETIHYTGIDDIFHIGNIIPDDFFETEKLSDSKELWLTFTRIALESLIEANKGKLPEFTIIWSSDSTEDLQLALKDYISNIKVQIQNVSWAHKQTIGVGTILSHEDVWDLNSGYGTWQEDYKKPFNTWQRIYDHQIPSRQIDLLEGGEATVWSSTVSSGELDSYVWPRAAALAERLWTDPPEGATRLVHARMDFYRSRLVLRGIQAAPLWSMWCTHNPFTC